MASAAKKITLSASRDIPFNKLAPSQANVRRIKAGVSIEELAEDIARRRLLPSITVQQARDLRPSWPENCFGMQVEKVFGQAERINFGALPPEIDDLLQQGVAAYRHDRATADRLFRQALSQKPSELAPYYCLYKIHTYMGSLDVAAEVAKVFPT